MMTYFQKLHCLFNKKASSFSPTDPNPHHSASLPPDAALLWDRWFKHALLLKERRVLNTEHMVQLFTPLLLERHATYSHQVALESHTLSLLAHAHTTHTHSHTNRRSHTCIDRQLVPKASRH